MSRYNETSDADIILFHELLTESEGLELALFEEKLDELDKFIGVTGLVVLNYLEDFDDLLFVDTLVDFIE